tara:strand:+ start:1409 stop:2518 length:1110 start_codon:yes stop_codon:yes gene_type:complete
MKKIAIIYLGNYYYDARLINMVDSLSSYKYAVDIVCITNKQTNSSETLNIKNVSIRPIVLLSFGFFKYIEFFFKVRKKIKNKKYHCVLAGDVYSLAPVYFFTSKAQLVYDCREIYSALAAHTNSPISQWLLTKYEQYFIKFFSDVIVTAPTDLSLLKIKFSKYQFINWHLIYNFPKYQTINQIISLRTKYDIPKNHTILCYQGVIQKDRGIGKLFFVLEQKKDMWACIVGDGEAMNYYKEMAKKLNIYQRVLFVGKVPYIKLLNYTAACDIGWVVIQENGTSNQFALPNKLFEYGLANIPVIASKLPNLIDILTKYSLGELVDSKNIQEQIKAIETLKNKKELNQYDKIIKNNFVWVVQEKKFINIVHE